MGSNEDRLCGWHLPKLETRKIRQKPRKAKCQNSTPMDPLSLKYKTMSSQFYSFQHFADANMYIDDYRKKHTVADAGKKWQTESVFPKTDSTNTAEPQLATFGTITRVPERKICLTGLSELNLSKNETRSREISQKTSKSRAFVSDVPHFPRLDGATKTLKKRKMDIIDERKHAKNMAESKK